MAFVYRTILFGSKSVRISGRSLSRFFMSGQSLQNRHAALKWVATTSVCVSGLVGTLYLASSKPIEWDLLKKIQSKVALAPVVKAKPCEDRVKDDSKSRDDSRSKKKDGECVIRPSGPCKRKEKVEKVECAESQPNIVSAIKMYSLFLWITLEPSADPCAVANAAVQIDEAIKATEDANGCNEEIIAGVGFGANILAQSLGMPCKNLCYRQRKGRNGELPVSDGDIFVHAKSDSMGQLFDFCKHYMHRFPEDSILEFEDIYGFDYKNGRDISGFIDNMTNRCKLEGLKEVAIECNTGGSYALAQKWVHDWCVVDNDAQILEKYIGRKMADGEEMENKSVSSHVARMVGSAEKGASPEHEILRQSQSYGSFSEKAGMFFLAFAADTAAFEFMLDRMVGASSDGEHDDVMKMSKNVKGNYWYFPGLKELESMKS